MQSGPKGQPCWEPYPTRTPGDIEHILDQLGHQLDVLRAVRQKFPYLAPDLAPFGVDAAVNNAIAHTVNENFVIRLCAVLDQNGVLGSRLDVDRDGFLDICIAKRLRNRFAHGRSAPVDSLVEDDDLLADMREHYHLDTAVDVGKFRLSIDVVLIPMLQGCVDYVRSCGEGADSTA